MMCTAGAGRFIVRRTLVILSIINRRYDLCDNLQSGRCENIHCPQGIRTRRIENKSVAKTHF
jgi:hypothetical protein